jgi:ubiquinone/menaquinone biosynthesis C-methylase UbiE/methyltransferase-like protein
MTFSAKPNRLSQSYDHILYRSNLHREGGLRLLESTASLFDVPSPEVTSCRVLELGCALGTTLLPQAEEYPESEFVGVDISRKQIEWARRMARVGGLENVDLKCTDLRTIDQQWGTFDYIICHGVYSWVEEEVRTNIFRICRELLHPDGIAMISYNTLPGWWFHRYLRDLLRFEQRGPQSEPRLSTSGQSGKLLRYMRERMPELNRGEERFFGQFIHRMDTMLQSSEEFYVYHDFLEEENHPCYFEEFHEKLQDNGLHYVADVNWQKHELCRSRFSPHRALFAHEDSRRYREQLFDFLFKETFRASIISRHRAHDGPCLENPATIRKYYGYFPMSLSLGQAVDETWQLSLKGMAMPLPLPPELSSHFANAARAGIGRFFSIDELIAEIVARLEGERKDRQAIRDRIVTAMAELVRGGFLELHRRNPQSKRCDRRRPYQIRSTFRHMVRENFLQLPNLAYELVELPPEICFLVAHMDGTRTDAELAEAFLRWKEKQAGNSEAIAEKVEFDAAIKWLSQSIPVLDSLGFLQSPRRKRHRRSVEAA